VGAVTSVVVVVEKLPKKRIRLPTAMAATTRMRKELGLKHSLSRGALMKPVLSHFRCAAIAVAAGFLLFGSSSTTTTTLVTAPTNCTRADIRFNRRKGAFIGDNPSPDQNAPAR